MTPAAPTVPGGPRLAALIGKGGEGAVWSVAGDPDHCVKIFAKTSSGRRRKLEAMLDRRPDDHESQRGRPPSIAWPEELYRDGKGQPKGFLMPRIANAQALTSIIVPKLRNLNSDWDHRYQIRAARNLATIVSSVHAAGYVIGDLNESNILVRTDATVAWVDCDSAQVRDSSGTVHRCGVAKREYLAPEFYESDLSAHDRTASSDNFALAVLIFRILHGGATPFAAREKLNDAAEIGKRTKRGEYTYRSGSPSRFLVAPRPEGIFGAALADLLERTFVDGAQNPQQRPSAADFAGELRHAEHILPTAPPAPASVPRQAQSQIRHPTATATSAPRTNTPTVNNQPTAKQRSNAAPPRSTPGSTNAAPEGRRLNWSHFWCRTDGCLGARLVRSDHCWLHASPADRNSTLNYAQGNRCVHMTTKNKPCNGYVNVFNPPSCTFHGQQLTWNGHDPSRPQTPPPASSPHPPPRPFRNTAAPTAPSGQNPAPVSPPQPRSTTVPTVPPGGRFAGLSRRTRLLSVVAVAIVVGSLWMTLNHHAVAQKPASSVGGQGNGLVPTPVVITGGDPGLQVKQALTDGSLCHWRGHSEYDLSYSPSLGAERDLVVLQLSFLTDKTKYLLPVHVELGLNGASAIRDRDPLTKGDDVRVMVDVSAPDGSTPSKIKARVKVSRGEMKETNNVGVYFNISDDVMRIAINSTDLGGLDRVDPEGYRWGMSVKSRDAPTQTCSQNRGDLAFHP